MSDVPCRASIDLVNHELNEERLEARYRDWVSSGERGAAIEKEIEELMTDPDWVSEGMGPDGCLAQHYRAKYKLWGQLAHDGDFAMLGEAIADQIRAYVIGKAIENADNNWRADDE